MTRISSGVLPIELCDSQLLGEHYEILRIPNTIRSGRAKVNLSKIPATFRLKTGHVTFFYNKLGYLRRRYIELHLECKRRTFDVSNRLEVFDNFPEYLNNDWQPDDESRSIVQQRIFERLSKMKKIRYYGQKVTLQELLDQNTINKSEFIKTSLIELI